MGREKSPGRGRSLTLEIKTAAEMMALDLEGRHQARRAARATEPMLRVFKAFLDHAEPPHLDDVVAAFPEQRRGSIREALGKLDEEDLVQIRAGRVHIAYPFSAAPTPFVVDLGRGRGERFACCAIDALGLAPMLEQPVRIRSRCHHCGMPLALLIDPAGPEPAAAGVMVWVGKRAEDERRACDSL
jgi:hypothetical protein